MSLKYFIMINAALHLTSKDIPKEDDNYDPRYKLGNIIMMLNNKFQQYYS